MPAAAVVHRDSRDGREYMQWTPTCDGKAPPDADLEEGGEGALLAAAAAGDHGDCGDLRHPLDGYHGPHDGMRGGSGGAAGALGATSERCHGHGRNRVRYGAPAARAWLAMPLTRVLLPVTLLLAVVLAVTLAVLMAVAPPGFLGKDKSSIVEIPAGGHSAVWDKIELPDFIRPLHYDLDFATHLEGENKSAFWGTVDIQLNITKPTNFIVVHAVGLEVSNATLHILANASSIPSATASAATKATKRGASDGDGDGDGGDKEPYKVPVRHEVHEDNQYHVFVFDGDLQPHARWQLSLVYAGKLTRDLRGYYLSSYKEGGEGAATRAGANASAVTAAGAAKWMATTQFEATDARRAFPCLDEPAMKATFRLTMRTPLDLHALANMPPEDVAVVRARGIPQALPGAKKLAAGGGGGGDTTNPNSSSEKAAAPGAASAPGELREFREFRFPATPRMSTYLMAFIVSEFEATAPVKTARGTPVRVWTQPGQTQLGEYAARAGAKIVDFYEQKFAIPYALPKLDLVSIPDFAAGAMENWGLVTYRDTALLLSPKATSTNYQRVLTVVAHELAHQWFGNLVTTAWWNSLYLQEGFAQFCEYQGSPAVEPDFQLPEQFYYTTVVRALKADAAASSHAIDPGRDAIRTPANIEELFDAISYAKGAALLRMVQAHVEQEQGGDAFFGAVSEYLKAHAYGNAVSDDLWRALSRPGLNVAEIMQAWVFKQGYPAVRVRLTGDNGVAAEKGSDGPTKIALAQQRFLNFGVKDKDNGATLWQVPVSYRIFVEGDDGKPRALAVAGDRDSGKGGKDGKGGDGGGDRPAHYLLKTRDAIVDLPAKARKGRVLVKPNVGQTGFYRTLLPAEMLRTAAAWLATRPGESAIAAADRAGLVEDALAAVLGGYAGAPAAAGPRVPLNGTLRGGDPPAAAPAAMTAPPDDGALEAALGMLLALTEEVDFAVWSVGADRLATLARNLEAHPQYPALQTLGQRLLRHVLSDVGWEEKNKDKHTWHVRKLLRGTVLALAARLGDSDTIKEAQRRFAELAKEPVDGDGSGAAATDVELVPIIVETAVAYGGESDYAVADRRFRAATLTADRLVYLRGMAQARAPDLVRRNVDLALADAGPVRAQDQVRLLSWVIASAPTAPALVLAHVDANWDRVVARFGKGGAFSSAAEMVENLAAYAPSPAVADDVARFFLCGDVDPPAPGAPFPPPGKDCRPMPPNTVEAVTRGLETARTRFRWTAGYGDRVMDWVAAQLQGSGSADDAKHR